MPEDDLADLDALPEDVATIETPTLAPGASVFNVQFDTPDVNAVNAGEAALRAVPGVSAAQTASLALGGVSVMRVGYGGDLATLAAALQARGWQVQQGPGTLRIRRAAAPSPTPSGTPAPK